ncbi:MAG TPA: protein-L-isoaspartate(D-aspartate) O-methyltransferase [Burkholderiales bacterium]|nr:protein-L-isoaspartate(D-aspartate) O-methyltransferase [Burkholderiales bacterium]
MLAWLGMNGADAQDLAAQRARMVAEIDQMYAETRAETGLAAMAPRVRAAIGKVERHRLVPQEQANLAYRNHPLPIGHSQTISQPYIVALSTDLLAPEPGHVVLEVGTGSGYQAAVLAEIVKQVYTIEIVEPLGRAAESRLAALGYKNVEVRIGDGYKGWPEKAPFDGIVVTAAAPRVPQALVDQLKPGGRMVIPIGERWEVQQLLLIVRNADGTLQQKNVLPVRFVPLVPGR